MPTLNLVAKAYFLVGLIASALIFAVPDVYAANRVILGNASATALAASTDAHTTQTLKSLRSKVGKEGKIRVIVGVRAAFAAEGELSAADVTQQRNEIAAKQLAVQGKISSLKASKDKIKTYSTIPFMALEVDATELEALAGQTDITSIEEDRIVHATLAGSVPLIGGTAAWSRGYTGAGQTVAILDTGVDKAHPFLTGKVVSEACYSTNSVPAGATSLCPGGVTKSTAAGSGVNCDPALAGCFHGTHVAGIAAGAGASFSGVAKNASMIAMQIFSRFTSTATCGSSTPCIATYTSDYNLALERVFALRSTYSIAAVNMSIGGGGYSNQATCDADYSATKTVIDNLRSVNIATIIASGNESLTNQISAPGCISTAISVGATSKTDVVASYSNSASFLKLLAPGSSITSSYPGSAYATASGTSMAAPHVAGAWALLKQQNATRSVTDTLSLLTATGIPLTDAKSGVTTPRIRLDVALNAVPTLSYSSEIGYGTVGVSPASGTSSTLFTYKVIYTDAANTPPTLVRACIDGVCNTMSADASAATTLRDSNYINGEQYVYSASLATGTHAYYFTATDGTTTVNLPASGSLTSPTVSSLTITTPILPDGIFGMSYSQALAAIGGISPYSWSSTTLPVGLSLGAGTGIISGTPTAVGLTGFSASVTDAASAVLSKALSINVGKATPIITWANPTAITYGTVLSATQLNVTANVPGGFIYTPVSGTLLSAGTQTLSAVFTPTDTTNYTGASATTTIVVNKATPIITWANPAAITYGAVLSTTQLNATANVPGSFIYTPVAGTVLSAGTQLLSAAFSPTDTVNYNSVAGSVNLVVNKATPVINCAGPVVALAFVYPMPLSTTQLNCSSNVPGSFTYYPGLGTVLNAGSNLIMVNFTPTDVANYNSVAGSVNLVVYKGTPVITWPAPAAITYPTALSEIQLNATANVPGSFTYSPAAGTVLSAGSQLLSASFTPFDAANYNSVAVSVNLVVNKATPVITWAAPAAITYPTALSETQLNASADVPGSFTYSPASGTVLSARSQMLSASFTPFDMANYNNASAATSLTVNKVYQIIILSCPSIISLANPGICSAAASSGLPVTLISATPDVCTLSGNIVSATSLLGFCTIVANQAGNVSYGPALPVTQNIVVERAGWEITALSKTATSVDTGKSFSIAVTVRNRGETYTTSNRPTVKFYLSRDTTITSVDVLIGSKVMFELPGVVWPALTSKSALVTVTVPFNLPLGVYNVGACIVAPNVVVEAPEATANTCRLATSPLITIPYVITAPRAVNLQMSAVSKTATVVGVSKTFTITNTEQNVGASNMTAASNTVRFYLSTDANINNADIPLTGSRIVTALAAGRSSPSLATTVTVPLTMSPRIYYVGACADATSVEVETMETDNCKAALGTINVVRNVDLVMSAVSLLPSLAAQVIPRGGHFIINSTEKNQGTVAMLTGTTNAVRFYLSTDATITKADILLTGSRTVAALAAGAGSIASTTVTVPTTVLPGVYYIGAIADGGNQLLESVENNNARAGGAITIN